MSKERDQKLTELAQTIADHQARIEKLGSRWGAILTENLSATELDLLDSVTDFMEKHKKGIQSVTAIADLERLERKIAKIRKKAFQDAFDLFHEEGMELSQNEQKWAQRVTKEITQAEGQKNVSFHLSTVKENKKTINDAFIDGMKFEEWFSGTAEADFRRIVNMVRDGVKSGMTIQQMIQAIRGTKANGYKDGILNTTYKHASSMARTLCCGIANNAKDQFYRDNDDVVIGVEWLDTLDLRTCPRCGGLSRKRWKTHEPHPVPPAHHNCYDDQTRVMTDRGLKYFRDLDGSELFFSFNPETEQLEFVPAVKHIRYSVDEKLIHFKNDRFDLLVTKNHQMFGYRKAKGCIEGYKFYDAENVPKWGYRIPCSAKWEGRKAMLTPQRIAWLRFMAFWLADGSKKYIPEDIKNSSPEEIRVFLDAFAKTDGSIRKGKFWKGYQFEDSVMYFTSSERMRDDLCELILKSGGRPSVTTKKTKDKVQKFRNGEYTINSDGYVIHHLRKTGAFTNSMTKTEVDYCGEVFCVELERNHTLYVERHGKFCWCGNCRCVLIPVTELTDMGEDMPRPAANADFMALAKEEYEQKYPGKKWEDLAYSTRHSKYYKAMKDFEDRTGKPAYSRVPGSMTYKDYILSLDAKTQKSFFGPEKYELWKNGGLSLDKFIPPYPDRAYTVKELKAMDKESFKK